MFRSILQIESERIRRVLRFFLVGVATGLFYMASVVLMVRFLQMNESHAAGLSYFLLLPPNFLAHKRAVFMSRSPFSIEVLRYAVMHIVAALVSIALMVLFSAGLGYPDWISSIFVILTVAVMNFIMMHRWVFSHSTAER